MKRTLNALGLVVDLAWGVSLVLIGVGVIVGGITQSLWL